MANLNIRERRLETRIAYMGSALSGRRTNFERLGTAVTTGPLRSVSWAPAREVFFRDCTVHAEMVALRGAATDEQTLDLVRDADGIVFVVDSAREALDRNRAALRLLRDALASLPTRDVPVVVQFNKADLEDAGSREALVEALQLSDWPHVRAAALAGEGVVETAERALHAVLDSLRRAETKGMSTSPVQQGVARDITSSARDNPLLEALRRVLHDTALAQVGELESRLTTTVERLFAEASPRSSPAIAASDAEERLRALADGVEGAASTSLALGEDLVAFRASHEAALSNLTNRIERALIVTERDRLVQEASERSVEQAMKELSEAVAKMTRAVAAAETTAKQHAQAFTETITRSRRDSSQESSALAAQIRTALDGLSEKVQVSVKTSLTTMTASLDALVKEGAGADGALRSANGIVPRLDQIEKTLSRAVLEGLHSLARKIDASRTSSETAMASSTARQDDVQKQLGLVLEEVKRSKKGWFA